MYIVILFEFSFLLLLHINIFFIVILQHVKISDFNVNRLNAICLRVNDISINNTINNFDQ